MCALGAIVTVVFVGPPRPRRRETQGGGANRDLENPVGVDLDQFLQTSSYFIPFNYIYLGNKIFSGGQGQIHEGMYYGTHVVLKELYTTMIEDDLKAFEREVGPL